MTSLLQLSLNLFTLYYIITTKIQCVFLNYVYVSFIRKRQISIMGLKHATPTAIPICSVFNLTRAGLFHLKIKTVHW